MSGSASLASRAEQAHALQALACEWINRQPLASNASLQAIEQVARQQLQQMVFPDRKTEAWKYTTLAPLNQVALWQSVATPAVDHCAAAITIDAAARLSLYGGHAVLNSGNGSETAPALDSSSHASSNSSSQRSLDTPQFKIKRLADLDATELARYLPLLTLDARWQAHPFAQLCEASLHQGWLIVIKANQRLEKPIVIEQCSGQNAGTSNLRILVVVESGAEATLVQLSDSLQKTDSLATVSDSATQATSSLQMALVQVHVQDNAALQQVQLQLAEENSHQILATQTTLNRDSRYRHYAISLGTALLRNDLHLQFTAAGAEAELNGAFLSKHTQHVDNHLNLEHISGRCQSTTRYKGLVTDQSRAVFNGRIHIHPQAQKTDAQLNNKNLLLSREAEIDTKPELEIYADDVKCAHGASIGQLDEKALFYFESRGIDKATAEAMLSFGFINEIVDTLPVPGLADAVTQRLMHYFQDVKQLGALWNT